ncbi:MAG: RluA family pseudouridine synthase [Bacillota bacterium]|jgi:23S rRNA pseudouridine1911/1915/1917 synthase|nr:RluA family pseudouridine synthase [Bacillota bacterium]
METIVTTPGPEDEGSRLDVFIAKEQAAPSRSAAQRHVIDGRVRVNGHVETRPSYRIRAGDMIEVDVLPPEESDAVKPENIQLAVVYEDDDLLVLNKPRGMAVHPGSGRSTGTLVNALLGRQMSLSHLGGALRPGIVHRLDKDTTGVMIVAKNDRAHSRLAADLAARRIDRRYLAIVRGNITENAGLVDAPIGRHPVDRKRQAVIPTGRAAITRFNVEERFGDYTLVRVKLETGRTHQIRVHMSYIGRPVAGDPVYGGPRAVGELGLEAQALHSVSLQFQHPITGENMFFEAPPPPDFQQALELLRQRSQGR